MTECEGVNLSCGLSVCLVLFVKAHAVFLLFWDPVGNVAYYEKMKG
jgi:hypothetical protein